LGGNPPGERPGLYPNASWTFPKAARWHNKIEALLFTRNGCSTKLFAGSTDHFHAKQDKP
jgi:hypothetical protein